MITQEYVRELFDYCPESGVFTWKVNRRRARKGAVAGAINGDGYVVLSFDYLSYSAHRIAVLWMDGYLPETTVDHKNRIRHDNRWENLREATMQCQNRNKNMSGLSSSGIVGVCWAKGAEKWMAHIMVDGKGKTLGKSNDLAEAVCLRLAAEQCLKYPDVETNSSAYAFVKSLLNKM